jgi:hypothetical protein
VGLGLRPGLGAMTGEVQEDVVQARPGQSQVVQFDAAGLEDGGDPRHVPQPAGLRGQSAAASFHVDLR